MIDTSILDSNKANLLHRTKKKIPPRYTHSATCGKNLYEHMFLMPIKKMVRSTNQDEKRMGEKNW